VPAPLPSRDVLEKRWDPHGGKHTKLRGRDWDTAVLESGERGGDAKYHPNVVQQNLHKTIEIATILEGIEFDGPNPQLRYFCREVTDLAWGSPLGCSDGELTNWCFVTVSKNPQATCHGRPRTKKDLQDLGANI
jgi:hypothetical protein